MNKQDMLQTEANHAGRPDTPRRVMVVDPRGAGISGDMMLAALVDMGADGGAISDGLAECARYLEGSTITTMNFKPEYRNGARCTRLHLETHDPPSRPAADMMRAVDESGAHLGMSKEAAAFARRSTESLISAESRIHGVPPDSVRLHEAASIDTLVDIVGTAVALEQTGAIHDTAITMPVNVGSGATTFSHGTYPNPTPAVLEILREAKIGMMGSAIDAETTTPTGACILAGLRAVSRPFYPYMVVGRTGHGAGLREHAGVANMLTVSRGTAATGGGTIYVLETDIDDITGESIGGAISNIMKAGALDATAHPGIGKKGRVSYRLSVLCEPDAVDSMIHAIIHHTGTLGVRVTPTDRFVLPRENRSITMSINGTEYAFRYKVRTHLGESDFKIEYDDISGAALKTGISAARVERLVRRHIEDHA